MELMDTIPPSSSPPQPWLRHRFKPTQPIAQRIIRALRQRLRLLHRSESMFFILGATGNVYTVNLLPTPACSCPDRTIPCKHILFVLIRVLGVSIDDSCLWRKTLKPCQLNRLLDMPTLAEALAGESIRDRFHELFSPSVSNNSSTSSMEEIKDGTNCPVCLEEMIKGEKIVTCQSCKNPIHEECLMEWKRSSSRSISCVLCRARWKNSSNHENYLNLSTFIREDEWVQDDDRSLG